MGYIIKNATLVNEGTTTLASVVISDDKIEKILVGRDAPWHVFTNYDVIDATGLYLIPGIIDEHVHFREPGLTQKADIYTESRAAVAGGVTSFMDMPNTNPQTTTQELLQQKFDIAARKSTANYSFYLGATNENIDEILKTDPKKVCGIKLFMGSSTGNMLVNDDDTLVRLFRESPCLMTGITAAIIILRSFLSFRMFLLPKKKCPLMQWPVSFIKCSRTHRFMSRY